MRKKKGGDAWDWDKAQMMMSSDDDDEERRKRWNLL